MNDKNIEKPSFTFFGNYRGLVEDNADPDDLGRIKVRVYNIHAFDSMPVDQLPWAHPALGLSWSGGYNLNNKDHQNSTPDVPGNRYDPGNNSLVSGTNKTAAQTPVANPAKFSAQQSDPYLNACGTGGEFVVPKRGNIVWVFFDGGNHMNPIYFAMATNGRDWTTQKNWRTQEIQQKINQIDGFRDEFNPRSKADTTNDPNSWAPNAIVNALVDIPQLDIPTIDESTSNRDITCITSPQGTTFVADNRYGLERIYLIHKNFIDFVDESGNKKIYAGKARGDVPPSSLDPDTPSNLEIGVEGDYELFVLGDWDCYVKGTVNIQVDGDAQIDVQNNVGIVSRQGDVDIIVEQGNMSAAVAGNADLNIGDNANIKVLKDVNLYVQQNLNAEVDGNINATIKGTATIQIQGDLDATIQGTAKVNATQSLDITSPKVNISGDLSIGGKVSVGSDANISGNCIVQQVVYSLTGINCGGYLYNNGPVNIGPGVTIHQLYVTAGSGTGTGRTPTQPTQPTSPSLPSAVQYESGTDTDKSELENGSTPNES